MGEDLGGLEFRQWHDYAVLTTYSSIRWCVLYKSTSEYTHFFEINVKPILKSLKNWKDK